MFEVGQRVRCIREMGNIRYGIRNKVYTVIEAPVGRQRPIPGESFYIEEANFISHVTARRFELVAPVQVEPVAESTTFYTLVYKSRGMASKKIMGFESEQNFEQKKAEVLRYGGEVLGTKKLKLSNV